MFGASNSTAGSSMFGSTQSKPAGFLLGSTPATNTQNAGSSFSFGSSAPKPATTGFGTSTTGFGASSGNNPSSGLFGNNSLTANTNGSLFGGNNTQNTQNGAQSTTNGAQSGGLFGKPATTLFGNASTTSGGLFGQGTTQNSAQPATGGLFGQTTALNTTQPASGGLFGAKPQTGGLFGASSSQPAQAGGAFGQTLQQPATGGLFGNNNTAKPSGGLFGNTPTTLSTQGGLFGNTNNASNASGGLFGAQNQSQNQNQNQAQTQGAPSQNQGLNSSQPSFGWSNAPQSTQTGPNLHDKITASMQAAQNTTKYTPTINDQLAKLKDQWNPHSPKSALNSHVYNKLSEQEITYLLQQPRPQNESPEEWEKAMAARPSPFHYPVKITLFTEVAQRVEVQLEQVAKSRVLLNNIHEKMIQLSSQRDLDTTTRMMKAKVRHNKLLKRLLKVATTLAVLKLKGYPLLPEEEEMSKQFQALNAKLSDPSGPVGTLSDLFARLAILKERSEDLSSQLETSISHMNGGLRSISDDSAILQEPTNQAEEIVQSLTKILYKQQVGLSYLNDVVQQDLAIVEKER